MPELQNLDVQWVSLVDRAAVRDPINQEEPRRFLVWKREDTPTPPKGEKQMPDDLQKQLDDALAAKVELEKAQADSKTQLEKSQADLEKAQADLAEATKKAEPTKTEPVNKDELAPEVRAALEKAETDAKASAERAEKAESIAKAEREIRLSKEFIAKAETFKGLPVEPATFGPVLKTISESVPAETYAELEKALNAADEGITSGDLFSTKGSDGDGAKPGASVMDDIQRKAEELRKADSSLSAADAFGEAMRSNPALQERYLAEMGVPDTALPQR